MVTNHHDQEKLRKANDDLVGENATLKEQLAALKNLFQQKETDHKTELLVCAETSHEQGHVAAVKEVKTIWDSKEFAAELMYGKCNPKAVNVSINHLGGRGQTHSQYDAIRRLMGYVYQTPKLQVRKGWRRRKFSKYPKLSFPSPICSKNVSKFAQNLCKESGLEEIPIQFGGAGAQFDPDKIVRQLIQSLSVTTKPTHVHLQVLGDGFRAMHSSSIVSVGARLLIETEEEAGDTSFTAIGALYAI